MPSGKIYSAADMVDDPQFTARAMIERVTLPDGTPLAIPAVVPKLSRTPGGTRWLGPGLGEHTDEVLAELGFDEDRIRRLRADRVI